MKIRDFPNILKFLDSRFRENDTPGDYLAFSDSLRRGCWSWSNVYFPRSHALQRGNEKNPYIIPVLYPLFQQHQLLRLHLPFVSNLQEIDAAY